MYYRLEPYGTNVIKEDEYFWFPNTLSYFFEQVDGYQEFSEPSQIEGLFNIDLSVFQKTYHPDEGVDRPILTAMMIEKIEKLMSSVKSKPELFTNMKWYTDSQDSRYEAIDRYYEEGKEDSIPEVYYYPPDRSDYFTTGDFLRDLMELQKVLIGYKRKGFQQVQLVYS